MSRGSMQCNILAFLTTVSLGTRLFHVSPPGDSAGLPITISPPLIRAVAPARSPTLSLSPPRCLVRVMVGRSGVVGL